MIEKVVTKRDLHDRFGVEEDLQYWLSRTPEERVNAVDFLWMQRHGQGPRRIQRVVRVIRRSSCRADLEALGEDDNTG